MSLHYSGIQYTEFIRRCVSMSGVRLSTITHVCRRSLHRMRENPKPVYQQYMELTMETKENRAMPDTISVVIGDPFDSICVCNPHATARKLL